jgi:predicted DNA-binding transcriptional regulator YafY
MDTIEGLTSARQQVAELEREMLEDVQAKATLLGYELVKAEGRPIKPQKRKRRTRAEIEATHTTQPPPLSVIR